MWGFLASARLCVIMSIPPTTTAIINIMEMLTLQLKMDFNRVTIPKTQKIFTKNFKHYKNVYITSDNKQNLFHLYTPCVFKLNP